MESFNGGKTIKPDIYVRMGSGFMPILNSERITTVPAGVYSIVETIHGNVLMPKTITSDGLVDLPNSVFSKVMDEIKNFKREETRTKFAKYGLTYKRGVLLHGAPGTGKTCLLNMIARRSVANGDVVIFGDDVQNTMQIAMAIRDIEPSRDIVVIWEEFDSILCGDEIAALAALDGENQIDGIMYLATTNYIDNIPERIKNRPSRFASVIEIMPPEALVRKTFLQAKVPDFTSTDLNKWVEITEGLTLDHIKDLIVSVLCLDLGLKESRDKIAQMSALDLRPSNNDDEDDSDDDYYKNKQIRKRGRHR